MRDNSFDPFKFYEGICQEVFEWAQTGLKDFSEIHGIHPENIRNPDCRFIEVVLVDGPNIVIKDVSGGLSMFRLSIERL